LLETSASKNNIKDVRQRSNLCNMTQKNDRDATVIEFVIYWIDFK